MAKTNGPTNGSQIIDDYIRPYGVPITLACAGLTALAVKTNSTGLVALSFLATCAAATMTFAAKGYEKVAKALFITGVFGAALIASASISPSELKDLREIHYQMLLTQAAYRHLRRGYHI